MNIVKNNISELSELYKECGGGYLFHEKGSQLLKKFASKEFIFSVIENYELNSNVFLTNYQLPHLTFFENENFCLRYNFFTTNYSIGNDEASHLIHHHGEHILSSAMVYGPGYKAVEFDKKISTVNDGSYKLNYSRTISHGLNNIYTVDAYTPHVIFNVDGFSVTCNLWSKTNQERSGHNSDRLNYFKKNRKFFGVTESEFLSYQKNITVNPIEKNFFQKCILFWMKKLGYKNIDFLTMKINSSFSNQELIEKDLIEPIINSKHNTMEYIMRFNDFI